jgi:mannosyl-3-phosphoglycerate phosphatase
VERLREQMANRHPFIVENGGALYVPEAYFGGPSEGARRRERYEVFEWGTPYRTLVKALNEAAEAARCRVTGFHRQTAAEIAAACGLTEEQAALAAQREYDEPFVVHDPDRGPALEREIENRGFHVTRGGRFWHIVGENDKAAAARALVALYERKGPVDTLALGDAPNDASLLNMATAAALVRSKSTERARALVPKAFVTGRRGPAGWAEAVWRVLG